MTTAHSLSHAKWDCKYHIVWIRNFKGRHFWARGYYLSTVGIDEVVIGEYIRRQEDEDRRVDQWSLGQELPPKAAHNNRFERFTSQATGFAGGL